jgi:hypothetical protein
MATDNKNVTIYLPVDVEEAVSKYCIENNITRRNQKGEVVPSIGTGIVQYLKSTLLKDLPKNDTESQLLKCLEERLSFFTTELAPLLALAADLPQSINIRSKPATIEDIIQEDEAIETLLEPLESSASEVAQPEKRPRLKPTKSVAPRQSRFKSE